MKIALTGCSGSTTLFGAAIASPCTFDGESFFRALEARGRVRYTANIASALHQRIAVVPGEINTMRMVELTHRLSEAQAISLLGVDPYFDDAELTRFLVAAFEDEERTSQFFSMQCRNVMHYGDGVACIFWQGDRRSWFIQGMPSGFSSWEPGDRIFAPVRVQQSLRAA